ncbi:MAG TPA: hypothetical protein VI413_06290 [Paludibacter sp.]
MRKIILLAAVIFCGMISPAQEIFFPTKEGTVLVYKSFDKKGKEINTLKYTITQLKVMGHDMDITYQVESIDPKGKQGYTDEVTIHKKGDKLYFDMGSYINKAAFQQNGKISADVLVTGNNMEMPSNPRAGDVLPDANVVMALDMGFMKMKMSADVTNRKVEAVEDITVKAGTFKSYKFTSDVTSSALGIKMKNNSIEWYAKGIGMLKTQTYDKNGNLLSYMELVELKE